MPIAATNLIEYKVKHGGLRVELDAIEQPWTAEVYVDQVLHAVLSYRIAPNRMTSPSCHEAYCHTS